jgi:hypothetical protein
MAKQIGMTELITKIGDENIRFQNLDTSAISLNYDHKKGSKITFGTDEPILPDGTERLGLILWLPRDKVNEIINA